MELTWTHEARELRRQRVACERDVVTSLLAFRKDAPACVSELEGLEKSGDADRSKERAALFHQCDRLKVCLR